MFETSNKNNKRLRFRILVAPNVDGLLLCWYFIIVSLATEAD